MKGRADKALLKIWLLLISFFTVLDTTKAQEGHYLSLSGIGQYTKLNNSDDFATRTESLIPEDTYNPAFGVKYTYNYKANYGLQTGFFYSVQGQKYRGSLDDSLESINYKSEVTLNYIRIPLKFRFNSRLDADIKTPILASGPVLVSIS